MINREYEAWTKMKRSSLPVVLYGIGDGADKILRECDKRGITVTGVFTSSPTVHKKVFHSMRLLTYEEARRIWGRMTVIGAFGTHDRDTIKTIIRIKEENDFIMPSLVCDGESIFDYDYYKKHIADIKMVRNSLSDEKSKEILDAIINYRITGDIDYLLPVEEDDENIWSEVEIKDSESFIDLGAYNGDTISRFLKLSGGKYSSVIGFEPDEKSYKKLVSLHGMRENVFLYNLIVSDREKKIGFLSNHSRGNKIKENGIEKKAINLDSFLPDTPVTLMKFDTEGEEENILEGSRRIIEKNKPKMILSTYHKADDLWKLLRKVKDINRDYKEFKIRASKALPDWDVVYLIK